VSQPTADLFIDFNSVTGEPYIGIEYSGGGVSLRLFVADKRSGDTVLKAFTECVDNVKTLKPKIVGAANASLR
jgi:hypothetical protein